MRRSSPLDLSTYGRAIPLLVRNPELTVVPFLSGLIGVAITRFLSPSADILGLGQLIQFLLDAFALAVSIILADMAWRYGRGSFDDAWTDARRKAGDILLCAIGINFVVWVADFAGRLLGIYFELALSVLAILFLIYALPATAIGGVPGGASLQVSIDRVRSAPTRAIVPPSSSSSSTSGRSSGRFIWASTGPSHSWSAQSSRRSSSATSRSSWPRPTPTAHSA